MPTRSGWAVLGLGVAAVIAGRVFGFIELLLIGVALLCMTAAALAFVNLVPLRLEIARSIRPARVHAGEASQVLLTLRNDGPRRTPVLGLHDAVRGSAGASLLAAPLERGARSSAAYALPTTKRGQLQIGPLDVELADAFGLARTSVTAVGRTTVTIYPRVVTLPAPPGRGGADPHGRRSRGLHNEGDEFHSLRPYVIGDDLRRVHWLATARRDELTVRQLDMHRHGRTTVLLETQTDLHRGESFETAVITAASVLSAAYTRGDELHLLSSGGHDSGIGDDEAHLDALLSWLATAEARTGTGMAVSAGDRHSNPLRITTDLDRAMAARPSGPMSSLTIVVSTAGDDDRAMPTPGVLRISRPDDLSRGWVGVGSRTSAVS